MTKELFSEFFRNLYIVGCMLAAIAAAICTMIGLFLGTHQLLWLGIAAIGATSFIIWIEEEGNSWKQLLYLTLFEYGFVVLVMCLINYCL